MLATALLLSVIFVVGEFGLVPYTEISHKAISMNGADLMKGVYYTTQCVQHVTSTALHGLPLAEPPSEPPTSNTLNQYKYSEFSVTFSTTVRILPMCSNYANFEAVL